jgi:CubicO group peptidase (beta-lactamase class C family)
MRIRKPVMRVAFLLCFTGSCLSTAAQDTLSSPANTKSLSDELLKQRLIAACDEHSLPGMWAGIFRVGGQSPIVTAAGKRNWNKPDLTQADDIVHLGSCTKAMTAVIIGQLCSEGKLRLDLPLREIFGDVAQLTESDWGAVTVHELLQHRSGVVANFFLYQSFDEKNPDSVVAARRDLLVALCKKKRPSSPGFVYSNVGFILLGHVAEHLENKAWEEIIWERLFRPLEMTSAGFGPVGRPDGTQIDAASLLDRAWGHTPSVSLFNVANSLLGKKAEPSFTPTQIDNSRCLGPAGRVHMNLQDWSKFVLPFASDDGYRQLKISPEVWNEMLKPPASSRGVESYAAGWIIFDKPDFGGLAYWHNGSNTTWYCYALAMPGKQQCILVATNVDSDPARKACDDVARFINEFPPP